MWSFLPTFVLLSVWFCLHWPLSQTSEWSKRCFHTTDEFKQGPFYPGPGPAVSVTPASLANIKARRSGRMEADLNLRSHLRLLAKRPFPSRRNRLSTRLSFLNMLWVSGPRCCLLLPRHHTSDRAWQLHHQWSRGLIPFGRSAPVNGQCGSLAPLGGYRWHQSHRSVWTLLTILTYLSLPVGEEAAVSGGETLHFTPFIPDRCGNRHKKWQLGQNLNWKTCASGLCLISHKSSGFQKSQLTSINHSSAFADLISIVSSSDRNTIFNYFLHLKITCFPICRDKVININCRWRPREHLLFHSLSFWGYVGKNDRFMHKLMLIKSFSSSLVTSNSWKALSINSGWQNVLYACHRSFFYLLWHECALKWMRSIFPRTPLSVGSARVGFCKLISYLLILTELEVRLRLTLSRRALPCALVTKPPPSRLLTTRRSARRALAQQMVVYYYRLRERRNLWHKYFYLPKLHGNVQCERRKSVLWRSQHLPFRGGIWFQGKLGFNIHDCISTRMISRDLSRNPEFNVPFLDFANIICLCIFRGQQINYGIA